MNFLKCACPHCAGHIEYHSRNAGQDAACPHCAVEITLPTSGLLPTAGFFSKLLHSMTAGYELKKKARQEEAAAQREARAQRIRAIQQNALEPIYLPQNVILQKGEHAYWREPGTLYEERVVGRRYEGGSQGVSIRVAKGVSFRVGAQRGQMVSETGKIPVAKGELILTSQRLIFRGDNKSCAHKLKDLIEITPALDGIRFMPAKRDKPQWVLYCQPNGDFVCEILNRIMADPADL